MVRALNLNQTQEIIINLDQLQFRMAGRRTTFSQPRPRNCKFYNLSCQQSASDTTTTLDPLSVLFPLHSFLASNYGFGENIISFILQAHPTDMLTTHWGWIANEKNFEHKTLQFTFKQNANLSLSRSSACRKYPSASPEPKSRGLWLTLM